ncbi:ANPRA-like protein [Mya arenaria]|uniref:ANPRA-like protein n=1 Tax=Mya arenaria TaxID=6604 RepID=A0ABY7ETT3_MYAAR|nr:ANPRA-like protein [Mya arenaria]
MHPLLVLSDVCEYTVSLGPIRDSISAIMSEYNWFHTAILYDISYVFFDLAGSNLVHDFRTNPDMERPYDIAFNPSKVTDYGELLLEARNYARVFVIFCDSDVLRTVLYRAHQLGDEKDAAVTRAYESLLLLTLRQPDNAEYKTFAEQVKIRAKRDYGYEFGPEEAVNYFITAFYDSAIYLALSYRAVLDDGGDIRDGNLVAQRLWNTTFQGPVKVDEVGNRVADFDLFHMKSPDTRLFERVGRFRGATQLYAPTTDVYIQWPAGLPVDRPPCGFTGELCILVTDDQTMLIIVLVVTLTILAVIVTTAVILLYRCRCCRTGTLRSLWGRVWNQVTWSL